MPLLRLRSDEQLVALFRAGHDDAFRVIHDRYRQRLFAYTRQMLPGSRQDAEDALQDVFVRAYSALRASDRELALRAWLYRVAHNRCVDELRRPAPPSPEVLEFVRAPVHDPIAEAEQRESLRRLIADVRRLPEQQRSALLMRELGGMSYLDLAAALGVSVPAVKSLLVRARVSLAASIEARDTACSEIRDELITAHDRRLRPNAMARRHLHDCAGCREFRTEMRGVSRQIAGLVPALGPIGVLANALGFGGGASGSAAAGGSAAAAGTGGAFAASGLFAAGGGHIATLLAAAVLTAGGAVEIQNTIGSTTAHHSHHRARASAQSFGKPIGQTAGGSLLSVAAHSAAATGQTATDPATAIRSAPVARVAPSRPAPPATGHARVHHSVQTATDPKAAAIADGAASAAAAAANGTSVLAPTDAGSTGGPASAPSDPSSGATGGSSGSTPSTSTGGTATGTGTSGSSGTGQPSSGGSSGGGSSTGYTSSTGSTGSATGGPATASGGSGSAGPSH